MSKTNKDLANAGLAGVAMGAVVGVATTMLLSDKKRRDEILDHANKMKKDLVDTTLKFKAAKTDDVKDAIEEVSEEKVVKAVGKKIADIQEK